MAGVVPKRSPSGRKQWSLQDGSRNSLKLLRSQLASEGCPESQVVLAKQLLDGDHQYHSHVEKKENERLGVYWLIKASQQGNEEATELLKTCLKTGKGISEHNFLDVKSCISMTQNEKLTRKAAREIFANLSNGSDYITTDQLQKEILSIEKKKGLKINHPSEILENGDIQNGEIIKNGEDASDSDSETDWTSRSESTSCSEKLTEDNLVSAAIDYSQGNLPLMSKSLCLTYNLQSLDNIPYVYRSILHPWLVLKIFHLKVLSFFCNKFYSYFKFEGYLFILLIVYSFFNVDNYVYILPIVIYYLTYIFMVLTTCQMLQNQRDFQEFRLWSGLFLCYSGGNLNAEQAEHQYIRNNLKPYGKFFIALLMNLFAYSTISEHWSPNSELMVSSFLLTFITLIGFMPRHHSRISCKITVLLSFAMNVLAKYPYDADPVVTQGWRFLDLKIPMFASFIIGNGIEFCLNFRLVLYAVIPILFIQLASTNNWRGTYKILIPHCVTLSWLQICIISSHGATMYGLLRGVLALVGVVMFLPLVGLTSVLIPAVALTKWLITSNMLYTIFFLILTSSAALFISWFLAKSPIRKYTAVIQIAIMIIALFTLVRMVNQNNKLDFMSENEEQKYLPWDIYRKFCYEPFWEDENIALSQLNCAGLENSLIFWDGYINDIKIKSITNKYKKLFDKLPNNINDYLRCYFGEEISNSICEKLPKSVEECRILYDVKKVANKCTLQKFDEYVFEITMKMSAGIWGKSPEILTLVLDNYFKNITLKLKSGDHIWFRGKLFNNENLGADGILGGYKPHMLIDAIGCHTCSYSNLEAVSKSKDRTDVDNVLQYFYVGLKFILNVLFNPVVIFR